MIECNLSVLTKQFHETHTDSDVESFQGKFSRKNGSTYIIYKQEDPCTEVSITNQIKVSPDGSISVRRMGGHQSLLQFVQDKHYTTFYNTGHGMVELTFKPLIINWNETEHGCTLDLQYDIYMGEEKLTRNQYRIQVSFAD